MSGWKGAVVVMPPVLGLINMEISGTKTCQWPAVLTDVTPSPEI